MRTKKKLHWTQTPEGKKRWAVIQKRAQVARHRSAAQRRRVTSSARKGARTTSATRTRGHAQHKRSRQEGLDEATFAYALGHVECWIQTFARGAAVPAELLTARLGEVLSGARSR